MKKLIMSAAALLGALVSVAQEVAADSDTAAAVRSEWLAPFTAVEVSAEVDIVFVRVPDTEAPRIVYDTKGDDDTRFRAAVKDKVLAISERTGLRRAVRTSVRVFYNELTSVSLSDAAATFEGELAASLLDLRVVGRASLTAEVAAEDLKLDFSGRSSARLTGKVRYLTIDASTGDFELSGLEAAAVRVEASNGASVLLQATERLEATTSTKGTIRYRGTPSILRCETRFVGGTIIPVE